MTSNNLLYSNLFYNKFAKDIYSQNGEDGIIEEILNKLEINNGYVCEFGAWDGVHLSNTFNLVTKGFNAVFFIRNDYYHKLNIKYDDPLENFRTLWGGQ
jgi:hypothetical protein